MILFLKIHKWKSHSGADSESFVCCEYASSTHYVNMKVHWHKDLTYSSVYFIYLLHFNPTNHTYDSGNIMHNIALYVT